jgi:putative oxygen-independent coproporphyrinogen III oxidase
MRHLYVHVPFCQRRCSYCDFAIAVRRRIPADAYVAAVGRELALVAAAERDGAAREPLETVYLGGGTPSLLPAEAVAALLRAIRERSGGAPGEWDGIELTLEANPEDVTAERAAAWRRAGVNRVSLGAQSFDDRVLAWMHRSHDARAIGDAVRTLARAGLTNVSLDLIFALPAELGRDWGHDVAQALALGPPHLSLYGLTVEERTPLARWIARGRSAAPDDARYAEEYLAAHAWLGAAGYEFYEVSNAARPGGRARHNAAYWSGRPYLGLGPAAHSFDGRARRWNVAAWEAYRRALLAGRRPLEAEEVLTPEARELERRYLALRTERGLALGGESALAARAARWVAAGWARRAGERVCLTPEGWLRLDALMGDLTGPGRRT